MFCLHVDDKLGTGDDLFELKLKELDKLVGFGSVKRQKFDHCAKQYDKTSQWKNHDFHEGIHSEFGKRFVWLVNA